MRGASENFVTARLMGVPANLMISAAFIISGLLAAWWPSSGLRAQVPLNL